MIEQYNQEFAVYMESVIKQKLDTLTYNLICEILVHAFECGFFRPYASRTDSYNEGYNAYFSWNLMSLNEDKTPHYLEISVGNYLYIYFFYYKHSHLESITFDISIEQDEPFEQIKRKISQIIEMFTLVGTKFNLIPPNLI